MAKNPLTAGVARGFHIAGGDKGGVGKSMFALSLIDVLTSVHKQQVVIFECDKANPDVGRQYEGALDVVFVDLSTETGWMDVIDTIAAHPEASFVMSTPAGSGRHIGPQLAGLKFFLQERKEVIPPLELVLWWVMNPQHDSVNLLAEANNHYGEFFDRIQVVCNTHFSDGNKEAFYLWQESPLRTKMEKLGTSTIYLPGLSLRVVAKLFHPGKIMPFADATDVALGEKIGFTESERHKLSLWRANVATILDSVLIRPKASAPVEVAAKD